MASPTRTNLPSFTIEEIKTHNNEDSLWLVFDGKVYDVTAFKQSHPGGAEVLLENAGSDATGVFQDVGHSVDAVSTREDYLIGYVGSENTTTTTVTTHSDRASYRKAALVVGVVALAVVLVMTYKRYK